MNAKKLSTIAAAMAVSPPEPVYAEAAVGACACGGAPAFTYYEPAPPNTMRSRVPANHAWYRSQMADACVTDEINSDPVTVAAGATVSVRVQPFRGCFDGRYIKVFVWDTASGDPAHALIHPFKVAECIVGCRNNAVTSRKYITEDCLGCPFPVRFGRASDGEELVVDVENPGAEEITVQVVVFGICRPGWTCLQACPVPPNGNGNGDGGGGGGGGGASGMGGFSANPAPPSTYP